MAVRFIASEKMIVIREPRRTPTELFSGTVERTRGAVRSARRKTSAWDRDMSTVRGLSWKVRPGLVTDAVTAEGVKKRDWPARPSTPYAATNHRVHPSGPVARSPTETPSCATRMRVPGSGSPVSVSARTSRKFRTVRLERSSVMFTRSVRTVVFRAATWEMSSR